MAKNSIRDYSATNSSNTDIQSIDISEGCSPAGINNAIREVMADLKDVSTGAVALESPAMDSLTVDTTGIVYSGGNVGIGTSSPVANTPLTLQGQSGYTDNLWLKSVGTNTDNRINIAPTGTGVAQVNNTNGTPIAFQISGSEKMRITSGGALLVGGSSPIESFGFATIQGVDNCIIINKRNTTSAASQIRFHNPNGIVGSIETSGTSTSYLTSSDYRLKENVTADWDATTRLKQLNPVRFNFIADPDTTVDGFLANEVQTVVPEAISGTHNGMRDEEYQVSAATGDIYTPATEAVLDEDGNEVTPAVAEVIHSTDVERPEALEEGQQWRETTPAVMGTRSVPDYQGIDQSKLVPLLVKTIQELEARITALEAN